MSRPLIVAELYENNRTALNLTWISGDLNRTMTMAHDDMSPTDLVLDSLGLVETIFAIEEAFEKAKTL